MKKADNYRKCESCDNCTYFQSTPWHNFCKFRMSDKIKIHFLGLIASAKKNHWWFRNQIVKNLNRIPTRHRVTHDSVCNNWKGYET